MLKKLNCPMKILDTTFDVKFTLTNKLDAPEIPTVSEVADASNTSHNSSQSSIQETEREPHIICMFFFLVTKDNSVKCMLINKHIATPLPFPIPENRELATVNEDPLNSPIISKPTQSTSSNASQPLIFPDPSIYSISNSGVANENSNLEENVTNTIRDSVVSNVALTTTEQPKIDWINKSTLFLQETIDFTTEEHDASLDVLSRSGDTNQSISNTESSVTLSGPPQFSRTSHEFIFSTPVQSSKTVSSDSQKAKDILNTSWLRDINIPLSQPSTNHASSSTNECSQNFFQADSQIRTSTLTQPSSSSKTFENMNSLPIKNKGYFSSSSERPIKKLNFGNDLRKRIVQVLQEPSFWDFVSIIDFLTATQ